MVNGRFLAPMMGVPTWQSHEVESQEQQVTSIQYYLFSNDFIELYSLDMNDSFTMSHSIAEQYFHWMEALGWLK